MSAAERLTEIGEILAAGIRRLQARGDKAGDGGDLSLDFTARRRRDGRKRSNRERP
jgi:hypothetical protein